MFAYIKVEPGGFIERLNKSPKIIDEVLRRSSEEIYQFLKDYHSRTDWKEGRWFPGSQSGQFAEKVVSGWQPPVMHGKSVTITNTFGLLGWKTTGGDITTRGAPYLTIPLIPEARGMSVAQFRSSTGSKPFRAGNAILRRIGRRVEAVYALAKSVSQKPYEKAMPPDADIEEIIDRTVAEVTDETMGESG
jgi:hypothetical protein